jgi:hypothetical protein
MKNFKSKFFYLFISLLGIAQVFAAPHPPSPTGKKPPPPPGLAIDDGIILLFILAIFLGIYIINKLETKQKTPFICK